MMAEQVLATTPRFTELLLAFNAKNVAHHIGDQTIVGYLLVSVGVTQVNILGRTSVRWYAASSRLAPVRDFSYLVWSEDRIAVYADFFRRWTERTDHQRQRAFITWLRSRYIAHGVAQLG